MRRRRAAQVLGSLLGGWMGALWVTGAALAQGDPPRDAGQPQGFRLEGKPALDDVFGDANDYRRTVDRFLDLVREMQQHRDEFSKNVQAVLAPLKSVVRDDNGKRNCPVDALAAPYARANRSGGDYLRVGRELTRHHDQIREFDRLGESLGLTPDYRWKVRRVIQQYHALLVDYREMKLAFHDQLNDELKFSGCDLAALIQKGDPSAGKDARPEEWPAPGSAGAPGIHSEITDKPEAPPQTLPTEKVPSREPIAVGKPPVARSGVLFYIDNTRCARATQVFLDGKRLGDVAASQRIGFQTTPGPHDLCLIDDATKKACGAPGTVRRSHLHEGWTIALRCE